MRRGWNYTLPLYNMHYIKEQVVPINGIQMRFFLALGHDRITYGKR